MEIDFTRMFMRDENLLTLQPGEVVFREGDGATCLYVVLDGEIDLSVRGFPLTTLGGGELFGEMALIDALPRSATATARTTATLAQVDERRFLFLITQTPYFALGVMRLMARRLRAMDETMH